MVLNLITGCVSPQYHCCFDDFFETTCTADQMFQAPSAGSNLRDWIKQPPFLPRCQRQYSAVLCILGHHLKTPFLWKKSLLFHHSTSSQRTTTASQTEILKSQRMHNHLASPRLLIKMRESQALSLLSQPVLVNVADLQDVTKNG